MKNKAIISIITLGMIISITGFSMNEVSADDNHQSIVAAIASKFNLNEDEVEAVIDAVREERQTQMRLDREERLNKAVSDGVISTGQKDALVEKFEEHQGERRENRDEMQAWFESEGIDHEVLRNYMGPKGGRQRQFREMD